ncbi:hypothetical protein OPV22_005527 [Ensete ventricosum]|uniref:Uncharacterized protein n=1 Tax=Ensete ventricosum TaxID=4639 RepID=A0AAV8Q326_ENSVE|nr:hypothetical protein OPV22_005527 [Ensete ventricosum]
MMRTARFQSAPKNVSAQVTFMISWSNTLRFKFRDSKVMDRRLHFRMFGDVHKGQHQLADRWLGWFGPQQLEAAAHDGGKDGVSDKRSVAYMETDTNPSDWSVASDDGMDFPMNAYLATHLVREVNLVYTVKCSDTGVELLAGGIVTTTQHLKRVKEKKRFFRT